MSDFDDAVREIQSAEINVKKKEIEVLNWEHEDYWRTDGSDAQDRRHEERGRSLKNDLEDAKRNLENKRKALNNKSE